jgi:hypothetical protein
MTPVRYIVTRQGQPVATLTYPGPLYGAAIDRLRYELALVADDGPEVLRGHAYAYDDGALSFHPRDADGRRSGPGYLATPAP